MLFNSWVFAAFFAVTYALYLALSHRRQNVLLLVASYVFYGYWDWRFLGLIVASTFLDYCCALAIHGSDCQRRRRAFLLLALGGNLGVLGFFKYFNFFADSLLAVGEQFGWTFDRLTLRVLLPVGISFYTFQSMSYTIDVYRRHLEPTREPLNFALFVSFFPQLVAGPIERASRLLPQVERPRRLTEAQFYEGGWLVFFGLFKKVFVADNLAPIVDEVFGAGPHSGAAVLIALYAFAFQIYCDFSGYSDMARGLAKLLGFELCVNFRMPYFATSIREFWHRWHISLSTWLRDYLYVPLGGNRHGRGRAYRNLMLTMTLGGLWHGAAWTFVAWGVFHGALLVAHRLLGQQRVAQEEAPVTSGALPTGLSMVLTFHLVCLGWLLFRSQSVGQAVALLEAIAFDFGSVSATWPVAMRVGALVAPLVAIQIYQERRKDLYAIGRLPAPVRGLVYASLAVLMSVAGASGGREFIYFQF